MDSVWRPRVTVATVVEDAGRYLMVEERVRGKLMLNQPAGHLDPGECLTQAAIRETLEETGYEVELTALLGVYQWRNPQRERQFVRFAFAAEVRTHHADRPLDDGIEQALWLTRDQLEARRDELRSPMVMRSIDALRLGDCHSLELIQNLNLGRS